MTCLYTNLVLLLLEGALGLLERRLQLELLVLEALADLVDLVDVAAAVADLGPDSEAKILA